MKSQTISCNIFAVTLTLCTILLPVILAQSFTHPLDVQIMGQIASSYPTTFGALNRWVPGTDPCTSGPRNVSALIQPWVGVGCIVINETISPLYRVESITLRHFGFKVQLLKGPFPTPIAQLPQVASIDLGYNALSGTIPTTWASPRLVSLDLSQNNLTGTIPPSITTMSSLRQLFLQRNFLTGTVPVLPMNIQKVRLSGNMLTGTIGSFVSSFSRIITLDLARNAFTGPIPPFPNKSPLRELYLNENDLTGQIPASITQLADLAYLDLGDNRLTGPIPTFRTNSTLVHVRLSCNELSGSIPDTFGNMKWLQVLQLEVNNLTGALPTFLETPPQLLGQSAPLYFNGSCNFYAPPLPTWCSGMGQNNTCVPCTSSQRVCYIKAIPIGGNTGGGATTGDGDGAASSSAAEGLSSYVPFILSSVYRRTSRLLA